MDALTTIVVIIVGIGAIVVTLVGLAALIWGWWFLIPIIGAWVGGVFGFLFGLGLVVIIWVITLAFKGK